ncbi:MAG: 50S ribosomal protein L25 [Limisphaerales bacterium]
MKSVALNAAPRAETRRNHNKSLRAAGRIPAVIYGRALPARNLSLDAKEFTSLLHHSASETILVDLAVQDDVQPKRLALIQEVQRHPLNGAVLHVDFHEVREDEKVTIAVPVETTGEAVGVKTGGGVLEHVLFRLKVRALPKDLPEQLVIDVTNLEAGRAIHIGDIQPPAGVEIIGNKAAVVIACALPRAEAEETAAAAAPAAGEVEMIKEKKDEAAAKPDEKAADKKAAAPAEKKAEKK